MRQHLSQPSGHQQLHIHCEFKTARFYSCPSPILFTAQNHRTYKAGNSAFGSLFSPQSCWPFNIRHQVYGLSKISFCYCDLLVQFHLKPEATQAKCQSSMFQIQNLLEGLALRVHQLAALLDQQCSLLSGVFTPRRTLSFIILRFTSLLSQLQQLSCKMLKKEKKIKLITIQYIFNNTFNVHTHTHTLFRVKCILQFLYVRLFNFLHQSYLNANTRQSCEKI